MNPSKRSSRSIEKGDVKQKSEHSSDQSDCYSSIVFSKQKRMKLMNGKMFQSEHVMVPNIRVRKFQIDPLKLAADEVFSDYDKTEKESEEDVNDFDDDQVPITWKFKVII